MYEILSKVIDQIVNPLIILLFVVALLVFVWGVYRLYIAKGGEDDRKAGSRHVLAGVIGMSIMIGAFAIIQFILNTLGAFFGTTIQPPPTLPL